MTYIFKWLVYLSSYIPVCIMIFLSNLNSFNSTEFFKVWNKNRPFWISILICEICCYVIFEIFLHLITSTVRKAKVKVIVKNVKSQDLDILNYFITYIIPILSLDVSKLPSIVMNLMLVFLEGLYFVNNDKVYYNVIFLLRGYHVFSFENGKTLITKLNHDDFIFDNYYSKQFGTSNIYYADKTTAIS